VGIPLVQKIRIGSYIMGKLVKGKKRFPLVLMLEPLFRCNLQCRGCGKIAHPAEVLKKELSVDECLAAALECGAPVVSIAGGEPLLHQDIHLIAEALQRHKRFVYLCTNALLAPKRMGQFKPSPYLTFNVHLDGLKERHDAGVCREGVFDSAVAAIKQLIKAGHRVTTNTTLFGEETPEGAAEFFDFVMSLGVEGMTVAPAFSYDSAADQDNFLTRAQAKELFLRIFELGRGRNWRFNHSSLYLEFLAGRRGYPCTPWGTPTRSIFGWQKPCYLLGDGYVDSFEELMQQTGWASYGAGNDPRCAECMVHCGFEPTAVMDAASHPWTLMGLGRKDPAKC
jgi:hopanoid biosynthesis associated radical SAM protein HpnH